MGIFDRLAETLDELTGSAPADAVSEDGDALALAVTAGARGQVDDALARFDELMRRHPRSSDVFEARGELLRAIGRLEEAGRDFGRAVDLGSARPSAWVNLGETLADLARLEPARDALRRALTLTDLDPGERRRALAGLGRIHGQMGQPTRAIREYRKLVELAPQRAGEVAALGRALLSAGELEGADWLARAARLPDGDPTHFIEAAQARAADGDARRRHEPGSLTRDAEADPSLRLLREASETYPISAPVRSALARRLSDLGMLAEARQEAEAGITAHPGDPEAWSALRHIRSRAGEFEQAIEAAARERELGGLVPFEEGLVLALGARSLVAIGELLEHGGDESLTFEGARAFHAGSADAAAILTLMTRAPDEAARRFVLSALAPPPVPRDNGLGLLTWARDFVLRQGADSTTNRHPLPSSFLSQAVPLSRAIEAFDRPLLLAVMGEFNAGKSSFVNAIAGAEVARVGVTPTTATINVLRYGLSSGGRVRFQDGAVRDLRTDQTVTYLANLDEADTARIRLIEVFSPTESLRRIEIVDTPGLNALSADHERVAREFISEADAVVWVFALGQAAKASEREVLEVMRAAGKKVLGVINKIDGAEPSEVDAVVAHVGRELDGHLARLVPFSARLALRARRSANEAELESSGLVAVESALEELFFAHARQLKQATALTSLKRFGVETAMAVATTSASLGAAVARVAGERAALLTSEAGFDSALAAERVALRARADRALRATVADVRELAHPIAWPFGQPHFDSTAEIDLVELLDDAIGEAIAATERALRLSITSPGSGGLSSATEAELEAALTSTVNAFEAYVRGCLEGAAAAFFRADAARSRLELKTLSNLLASYAPEPERRLFQPLEREMRRVFARARAALDAAAGDLDFKRLFLEELVMHPLAGFEAAIAAVSPEIDGAADEGADAHQR